MCSFMFFISHLFTELVSRQQSLKVSQKSYFGDATERNLRKLAGNGANVTSSLHFHSTWICYNITRFVIRQHEY